jgi:hypothetical protein
MSEPLKWTSDRPTVPGYYWKFHPESRSGKSLERIVIIRGETLVYNGHLSWPASFGDYLWYGPIAEPDDPPLATADPDEWTFADFYGPPAVEPPLVPPETQSSLSKLMLARHAFLYG